MVALDEIPEDLWIFGYGSIVWKYSEVSHTARKIAYIHGFKRRFWQASPDHRGTPQFPGRVVSIYSPQDFSTLGVSSRDQAQCSQFCPPSHRDHDVIPNGTDNAIKRDPDWIVHGVAFQVTHDYRARVVADLLTREKDGFEPIWVPVYHHHTTNSSNRSDLSDSPQDLLVSHALTFKAPIDNPSFTGFQIHADIAARVVASTGISGANVEYALRLHDALHDRGVCDPHLDDVVRRVRALCPSKQ